MWFKRKVKKDINMHPLSRSVDCLDTQQNSAAIEYGVRRTISVNDHHNLQKNQRILETTAQRPSKEVDEEEAPERYGRR